MTPSEVQLFLDAIGGDRLEALFILAVAVGLRLGEALGLLWDDAVDLDQGTLTVRYALQRVDKQLTLVEPKTLKSRRTLYLPQFLKAALLRHRAVQEEERLVAGSRWRETGFVFTTKIGTPLDGSNVTKRFQRLLQKNGMRRMRFHDLRHVCASLLLLKGVHPRLVMETLGHSQISLTMNTYSHVISALQKEVASQMDEILSPVATNVATQELPARVN